MSGPQPGTPTPWSVSDGAGRVFINGPRSFVCAMDTPSVELQADNAAAIVHRMNNWGAVVEALEAARNCLANSGAESGYCMCGDPVESHSIGSGHSPVDSHTYVAGQVIEQIKAALTLAKSGGNS